jgi:NAD-dependent deacetylase
MRIVALTGSGVSAESGVSTFRDKDGIWAKHDWREVATPEGFAADPARVHDFYNARRRRLASVQPNAAHAALAELEARLAAQGASLLIVTQNVDDLHERAGSKALLHMHGELLKARCAACGDRRACHDDLSLDTLCPACGAQGAMRPDVVWFGETPHFLEEIAAAIARADLFVSIGTSGSVYPAAGFVAEARAFGVPCVELNLEPSENAHLFTDVRYGPASDVVPAWAAAVSAPRTDPSSR